MSSEDLDFGEEFEKELDEAMDEDEEREFDEGENEEEGGMERYDIHPDQPKEKKKGKSTDKDFWSEKLGNDNDDDFWTKFEEEEEEKFVDGGEKGKKKKGRKKKGSSEEEEPVKLLGKKKTKKEKSSGLVFTKYSPDEEEEETFSEGKKPRKYRGVYVGEIGEPKEDEKELFKSLLSSKLESSFHRYGGDRRAFLDVYSKVESAQDSEDEKKYVVLSKRKMMKEALTSHEEREFETIVKNKKLSSELKDIVDRHNVKKLSIIQQLLIALKLQPKIKAGKPDDKELVSFIRNKISRVKGDTLPEVRKSLRKALNHYLDDSFKKKDVKTSKWKHSDFEGEEWMVEKKYGPVKKSEQFGKVKTLQNVLDEITEKVEEVKSSDDYQTSNPFLQTLLLINIVAHTYFSLNNLRTGMRILLETRMGEFIGKPPSPDLTLSKDEEVDKTAIAKVEKVKKQLKGKLAPLFVNALVSRYDYEAVASTKLDTLKKSLELVSSKARKMTEKAREELDVDRILDSFQDKYGKNIFDLDSRSIMNAISSSVSSTALDRLIASGLAKLNEPIRGMFLAEKIMPVIYSYIKSNAPKEKDFVFDLAKKVKIEVRKEKKSKISSKRTLTHANFVTKQVKDFEEEAFETSLNPEQKHPYDTKFENKYLDVATYLTKLTQPLIFVSSELAKVVTKFFLVDKKQEAEYKAVSYARVYNKKLLSGNYVLSDFKTQLDYFPELAVGVNTLTDKEWKEAQLQLDKIQNLERLNLIRVYITPTSPIYRFFPQVEPVPKKFNWSKYLTKFPGLCYGKNAADITVCKLEGSNEFYCDSTKRIIDDVFNNKGIDSKSGKPFDAALVKNLKKRYSNPSDYVLPKDDEKTEGVKPTVSISPISETVTGPFIAVYQALEKDFSHPVDPNTNQKISEQARTSFAKLYPILYKKLGEQKATTKGKLTVSLPKEVKTVEDVARYALGKHGVVMLFYTPLFGGKKAYSAWEKIPQNEKYAYLIIKTNEQHGKIIAKAFNIDIKKPTVLFVSEGKKKEDEEVVKVKVEMGGYQEGGKYKSGEKRTVTLVINLKSTNIEGWLKEVTKLTSKTKAVAKSIPESTFKTFITTIHSGESTGQENVIEVQEVLQEEPKLVNKRIKRELIPFALRKGFVARTTPLLLALKRGLRTYPEVVLEKRAVSGKGRMGKIYDPEARKWVGVTTKKGKELSEQEITKTTKSVSDTKLLNTYKRLSSPSSEEINDFEKMNLHEKNALISKTVTDNYNQNYLDLIQTLLDAGANPNAAGADKVTPLVYVVGIAYTHPDLKDVQFDLVKNLMKVGANPYAGGINAVDVAKKVGNKALAKYMEETKPGKRVMVKKAKDDEGSDEEDNEKGSENDEEEGSENDEEEGSENDEEEEGNEEEKNDDEEEGEEENDIEEGSDTEERSDNEEESSEDEEAKTKTSKQKTSSRTKVPTKKKGKK